MMRTIRILAGFVIAAFCIQSAFAQNMREFKLSDQDPQIIELNRNFSSTTEISPFGEDFQKVYGLALSGNVTLQNDDSYVRVTMIDERYEEHLVYESYSLIVPELASSFDQYCEETALLDGIRPGSLYIEIKDAALTINRLEYSTQALGQNISVLKRQKKQAQIEEKVMNLNQNLQAKGKHWVAGHTSVAEMSFAERKKLYGQGTFPPGFEYYSGGVIQAGKRTKSAPAASPYIPNWDWRDRHGQNWITSIKDQNPCGSCWAFAVTGATEAMANVYFNIPGLNLDLSEQDVLSCSGAGDCGGGYPSLSLDYIRSTGIVNEGCFPYTATDQDCSLKCSDPSERIKIAGRSNFYSGSYSNPEDELKKWLIQRGPISGGLYDWSHAMTLVGYRTVEVGDYLYFRYNNTSRGWLTVPEGHALVGKTVWIFKNSWGTWFGDGGYVYVETEMSNFGWTHSITTPVTSEKVTRTVQCTDADGDGYYWWGIGPKPDNCPPCPALADGDDSDDTKGPLDEYGYCTPIEAPPVANFTSNAQDIGVGDQVSFTDLSSGAPTSWEWTFENGTETPVTSYEQNPVVTYNSTGTFDVSLKAINVYGSNTIIKTAYINVTIPNPVANFTANITSIPVGGQVTFTDQSQYCTSVRSWSFPGGNANLDDPMHPVVIYNTVGQYDVTLQVWNVENKYDIETKTAYISVYDPLKPDYCAAYGDNGYEWIDAVSFADMSNTNSNAEPGGYSDFSDSHIANVISGNSYTFSITPEYIDRAKFEYCKVYVDYNLDGYFADPDEMVFNATKIKAATTGTIYIPAGLEVSTTMRVIMARSQVASSCGSMGAGEVEDYGVVIGPNEPLPPVANFSYSAVCNTIYFTDESYDPDGQIISRLWDFGEGVTSSDVNPQHTFATSDTHEVTLTVTDNDNMTDVILLDVLTGQESLFYLDFDQDGFGDPLSSLSSCEQPNGYVTNNLDCNDQDQSINPDAPEICGDDIDNNCNGNVDEGCDGPVCVPVAITSADFINVFTINGGGNLTNGIGDGYIMNTNDIALIPGDDYTFYLAPDIAKNRNYWRVWIDYDGNSSFDSGELVISKDIQQGGFQETITVPSGSSGIVFMRVSLRVNKAPLPCDDGFRGEVEDYTINFEAGKSGLLLNQDKLSQKSFNIYPNPTSDILFIDFNQWEGKKTIKLIELTGKTLFEIDATSTIMNIDLNSYPKGIYFLEVNDGVDRKYRKISKQ